MYIVKKIILATHLVTSVHEVEEPIVLRQNTFIRKPQ